MTNLLGFLAILLIIIAILYMVHILVIAWRVNIIWFLICLFVPFGIYAFTFMNWEYTKRSFLHSLAYTFAGITLAGLIIVFTSPAPHT
jgi:hypothetical protein